MFNPIWLSFKRILNLSSAWSVCGQLFTRILMHIVAWQLCRFLCNSLEHKERKFHLKPCILCCLVPLGWTGLSNRRDTFSSSGLFSLLVFLIVLQDSNTEVMQAKLHFQGLVGVSTCAGKLHSAELYIITESQRGATSQPLSPSGYSFMIHIFHLLSGLSRCHTAKPIYSTM